MPQKKHSVTLPTVYDEFQCKGGACRNTCCQGWTISVTRSEYNKIRHRCKSEVTETAFKRVPRKEAHDEHYANMHLQDDLTCPFLDDQHLCALQREYGANILPKTCKQFPCLLSSSLDKSFQLSLDLGCERVLELLWDYTEKGLSFLQTERDLSGLRGKSINQNSILADYFTDIRNLSIWILQNRAYSLSDRIILLGLCLRELHEIEQSQKPEQIPHWFIKWQPYIKGDTLKEVLSELSENRRLFVMNNLKNCLILSKISKDFEIFFPILEKNISFQKQEHFSYDIEQYDTLHHLFETNFPTIDCFLENYMIFVLLGQSFSLKESHSIWQDYNYLCQIYSLMRFYLIVSAPQTMEQLIDALTNFSRSSINMSLFSTSTVALMEASQSDSLAHLAILIRG